MRLSQRLQAFATPSDSVSHLGPRPGDVDEGPLTLCGLYLEPMVVLSASASAERRACVVCDSLRDASRA